MLRSINYKVYLLLLNRLLAANVHLNVKTCASPVGQMLKNRRVLMSGVAAFHVSYSKKASSDLLKAPHNQLVNG